jgi:GDPmannose 4,6-dehydratase
MKTALITGISGQDGSYLAEYLLGLGYRVVGLARRSPETMRYISQVQHRIEIIYGDLRDDASVEVAITKTVPDEIYNLGAQVFVPTSWQSAADTFDINVGGLARLLQIVARQNGAVRVFQASSSEMFGNHSGVCSEATTFTPTSPYGISKLAAHRLAGVYRDQGIYAVGGIMFNHESPRRGPEMVTRKITLQIAAAYVKGERPQIKLGHLDVRRDWGFAGDYVRAMHAMLQVPEPRDYVIGTGISHSVREFAAAALAALKAINRTYDFTIDECVQVDSNLFRRGEIRDLRADATAAREQLGWAPAVHFAQLVRMMLEADIALARQQFAVAHAAA